MKVEEENEIVDVGADLFIPIGSSERIGIGGEDGGEGFEDEEGVVEVDLEGFGDGEGVDARRRGGGAEELGLERGKVLGSAGEYEVREGEEEAVFEGFSSRVEEKKKRFLRCRCCREFDFVAHFHARREAK